MEEDNVQEKVLKLLEDKKFGDLRKMLEEMNSTDLSLLFNELSAENMLLTFRLLSKDQAAETFSYMEPELQEKLIASLTDKELKEVIDELFLDDTVDLIEEMPSNVVKRIFRSIDPKERKVVNEFLNYPDDSAGSIMTNEFVDLKENMTVEQAFEKIKKIGIDKETIYTCYVLNMSRKLIGVVTAKDLLLADREQLIKDIMDTNIISVTTLEDKEVVAKTFDKYDIIVLPVVDTENRLVGIITIDDAIDVIQEENTEDFTKMAAITPNDDSYFKMSVFKHAKSRIVWLLVLMFSSMITGGIIANYEAAFAAVPILVSFIPMLMDTGGNCGSQSSTLVIRGLAMEEIKTKDFLKVWWKEVRVAVIVGIIFAVINGIRIMIQYNNMVLALTVGLTLIVTVILSKSLGCILPIVAKKLKMDPAIMAAPLITTIVDTCSVFIFFNFAILIMGI